MAGTRALEAHSRSKEFGCLLHGAIRGSQGVLIIMKIAYTSDLHLEASPRNPEAARRIAEIVSDAQPDLVVLAGDVGDTLESLAFVFELFSPTIDGPKLFVPGNHDFWVERGADFGRGSDSGEKYASLIPALSSRMGFVDIGHGPYYVGDIAFVGSVGWYDYSLADPRLDLSKEDYREGRLGDDVWWDHKMISWRRYPRATAQRGLSDEEICNGMAEKLRSHIVEAEGRAERIVAVIHTCPFAEALPRSPEPYYMDAYMGSERIGAILRSHEKIGVCITGHKHENGDWKIGGISVHRRILGSVEAGDSLEARAREAVGILEI